MIQRAQAILSLLESQSAMFNQNPLTKSEFQQVGISPKDMDQWLELIQYIQSMPRVSVYSEGRKTFVEIIENKFLIYLRQRIYNQTLSYEERQAAAAMYVKVMVNEEKVRGEDIDWKSLIDDPWEISRPRIIQLVEEGKSTE
jgi:hypothetical protein